MKKFLKIIIALVVGFVISLLIFLTGGYFLDKYELVDFDYIFMYIALIEGTLGFWILSYWVINKIWK